MTEKSYLTRSKGAAYITDHYFPCRPATLAKASTEGTGPLYQKAGRIPLYTTENLDLWALSKLSPEVKSSSELPRRPRTSNARLGRPTKVKPSERVEPQANPKSKRSAPRADSIANVDAAE